MKDNIPDEMAYEQILKEMEKCQGVSSSHG